VHSELPVWFLIVTNGRSLRGSNDDPAVEVVASLR